MCTNKYRSVNTCCCCASLGLKSENLRYARWQPKKYSGIFEKYDKRGILRPSFYFLNQYKSGLKRRTRDFEINGLALRPPVNTFFTTSGRSRKLFDPFSNNVFFFFLYLGRICGGTSWWFRATSGFRNTPYGTTAMERRLYDSFGQHNARFKRPFKDQTGVTEILFVLDFE